MKNQELLIETIISEVKKYPKLYKSFDFSNVHQKYSLYEYLIEILYVLKTGISWRDLRSKINWISVYKTFCKLVSQNIFQKTYKNILGDYLDDQPKSELKYLLTDTTFIPNKKGHDMIGYNTFYNRKYGTKISLITTAKGVPLDVKSYEGNRYDSVILGSHLDNLSSDSPILNNRNDEQHNKYFLADAGYDSKVIREKLINLGYTPKIPINKRNRKKKPKIIKSDKKIYKKRLNVEIKIKNIKDNKRLINRYDSKIKNFMSFIYFSLIKLLT
jgi:transposase